MNNNKNVLLAIALAAAVLFLWQYFVATPAMKAETARQEALTKQEKGKPPATASASGAPNLPGIAGTTPHMSRDAALKAGGARIAIDTPMVDGSILLKGAKLDDLRLKKYRETVDPKSAEIVVLAPKGTDYPYYATFGWVGAENMPNDNSEWRQTNGGALSPGHPVTLTWDNGRGLVFTRIIAIDDQYMFTISDSVANRGGGAVNLFPYGTVERQSVPKTATFFILHEGFGASPMAAKSMPSMTTSRSPAPRPRRLIPPAAGSASPTNTGWRRSFRPRAKTLTAPIWAPRRHPAWTPIRPTTAWARASSTPAARPA